MIVKEEGKCVNVSQVAASLSKADSKLCLRCLVVNKFGSNLLTPCN